jgi:hypothetical protein
METLNKAFNWTWDYVKGTVADFREVVTNYPNVLIWTGVIVLLVTWIV